MAVPVRQENILFFGCKNSLKWKLAIFGQLENALIYADHFYLRLWQIDWFSKTKDFLFDNYTFFLLKILIIVQILHCDKTFQKLTYLSK